MHQHKYTYTIIGLLLLSLTGCTSSLLGRGQSSLTSQPLTKCLLRLQDLPQGWYQLPAMPYDLPGRILPGRAEEAVAAEFAVRNKDTKLHQDVLLYSSEKGARNQFAREETFPLGGIIAPWETPVQVNLSTLTSDQYKLACADMEVAGVFRVCQFVARYDTHLVIFSTWMSPDYMSYTDLETTLLAINQQMTACIHPIKSP